MADADGWTVTEQLSLAPGLLTAKLTLDEQETIKAHALERAAAIDPMLRHVLEVKVVVNQRRNFINMIVRKDYISLLHLEVFDGQHYCFFMSDKLEPFVIITVVDPVRGKLHRLTQTQVGHLDRAVANFRQRFGVTGETYHYTGLEERNDTETFVRGGGANRANKAHSAHFHLKMRIGTAMMTRYLPVLGMFDFGRVREQVEPVRYNYSRQTASWGETLDAIKRDSL